MGQGNRLAGETSPYLRQHADNPVDWRPWGAAALAEAARRDVPILLSIGYAACHWCHVMAHESFEDPRTAAVMNALFVCIKVDREERPDIDGLYMNALHALGEQGGWPLTMFLMPDGAPFWGGTYFPPEPRYGRPSFNQVLRGIAEAYAKDRAGVGRNAAALIEALAQGGRAEAGAVPDGVAIGRIGASLLRLVDPVLGGIGQAPKFPNAPIFRLFWQLGRGRPDGYRAAVRQLLVRMSEGGICDQLGGGFSRYSTDAEWLAPHFEKMLYDNAQILDLLAFAHAEALSPLFAARAEELVGWLRREMMAGGAFAASQDADSEGVEGKFYVWSAAEIHAVLGARAPAFMAAYDVSEAGNWEGQSILRWVGGDADPAAFAADRAALLAVRDRRVWPGRDDKVLADWNGLMIAALARAAGVFGRPEWLAAAVAAFQAVMASMGGADGRVAHAWCDGVISAAGLLDDQAAMARAAVALFEATGERAWLARAGGLVAAAEARFSAAAGGFYLTADDAQDVPLGAAGRVMSAADGPSPAGNGMMAEVYGRLFLITGEDGFRVAAERVIATFSGSGRVLGGAPGLLAAADLLVRGGSLEIGESDGRGLFDFARGRIDPLVCVVAGAAGFEGARLCQRQVCGLPVHDPDGLAVVLSAGFSLS